jgi:EmrB/QacA subfamily drug resistance transporter
METVETVEASQDHHPALVLATLCVANFMATLDLFVVNVALKDIGTDFGGSLSDLSWTLNAYAIVFGALLVPAGRFADKYGRRNCFVPGLAIFTGASLACALSPNLWALVAFRAIQAAGAAIFTPASLGLVLTALPAHKVANGVRLWAVSAALAGAAGPVIGGLLTDVSWRLIFVVNIPIGIAAIFAVAMLINNVIYDKSARIPDVVGTATLILSIGALSLGLVKGADWGWTSSRVLWCWVVAIAAGIAFVISTQRARVPVIDFGLFRSRVFTSANIAAGLLFGLTGMQLLTVSYFLQQSWHWSTIETGLAIAPGPAMVLTSSMAFGPKLNARFSPGRVAAAGFILGGVAQALIVVSLHHWHSYPAAILPGWIILGTGLGLALPTIVESATVELSPEMSATGSAINSMARQIGAVFGTAVVVIFLGTAATTGAPARYYNVWWIVVGCAVVGALVSLGITPRTQDVVEPHGQVARSDMTS